jgi:hypothetical protein
MSSDDNVLLEEVEQFSKNGGDLVIDAASTSDAPSPALTNIIPRFQNLEFVSINDNAREVEDSNWRVVEADAVNPDSVNQIISKLQSRRTLYTVFNLKHILNPGYRIGQHLDDEKTNKERRTDAIEYFSKSLSKMNIRELFFTAAAGDHGYFSTREIELLEEELENSGFKISLQKQEFKTGGSTTYRLALIGSSK